MEKLAEMVQRLLEIYLNDKSPRKSVYLHILLFYVTYWAIHILILTIGHIWVDSLITGSCNETSLLHLLFHHGEYQVTGC